MEIASAYTQFREMLLNYIRSKVRSNEDAKDILQNVFAKISTQVNSLDGKDNIRHWLFIVTRNAIIDYYRSKASGERLFTPEDMAADAMEETSVDATQGLDKCMNHIIQLMPDTYKSIIIDSELIGVRQKELAIKYNIPYSSLRSRVQRGREKLKELFRECCSIEADRYGNILNSTPKKSCDTDCGPC